MEDERHARGSAAALSSILTPLFSIPARGSLALPLRLHEVMLLRRDVEGGDALADALVLVADAAGLLEDVHVDGDVELGAGLLQRLDVLAGLDPVDRRAEAGAEELVLQVLADDSVVSAADA